VRREREFQTIRSYIEESYIEENPVRAGLVSQANVVCPAPDGDRGGARGASASPFTVSCKYLPCHRTPRSLSGESTNRPDLYTIR